MQIDFANEYIGGGVLRSAAVQEEIMFIVKPECLLSLLFFQKMDPHESIAIIGAKQFAASTGYRQSFKFVGPYKKPRTKEQKEETLLEEEKENKIEDEEDTVANVCVAIDAIIANSVDQYSHYYILREVIKAYSGFSIHENVWTYDKKDTKPRVIATGNWGCGAFAGSIPLKSMLQWISASKAGRSIHYYPFGDHKAAGLADVTKVLLERKVTVGQLWSAILDECSSKTYKPNTDDGAAIFGHLIERFSSSSSSSSSSSPSSSSLSSSSVSALTLPTVPNWLSQSQWAQVLIDHGS